MITSRIAASLAPVVTGLVLLAALLLVACGGDGPAGRTLLLEEDFSGLAVGMFSADVGPHTEYHYLPEAAPKGGWAVSCFPTDQAGRMAWRVDQEQGGKVMSQLWDNRHERHTHSLLVAGDTLWADYILEAAFAPASHRDQAGVVFRYRNDRCYYFFGVSGDSAVLKLVRHETGFHQPDEKILAAAPFVWQDGQDLKARIELKDSAIRAAFAGGPELEARDETFLHGRIGLTADVPTRYRRVAVSAGAEETARIAREREKGAAELAALRAENPRPVVWKKLDTEGFGAGRNLRFGDLDGDGADRRADRPDPAPRRPRDSYSELSCLTAMTFEGKRLWQVGQPDPGKWHLTNDVAFQIHDLDGDGKNEVIYTMGMELIVAEGATGRTRYKAPTPVAKAPADSFPRILGDCLFFCDLRGRGTPGTSSSRTATGTSGRWMTGCSHCGRASATPGITPMRRTWMGMARMSCCWATPCSMMTGASCGAWTSRCGTTPMGWRWWTSTRTRPAPPVVLFAASDAGVFFTDLSGNILRHHWIGHGQNPAVADFRPELPGLETVSVNFWGNQGIIHFFDARGEIYHDFEPTQYGSMCLPINWTGDGREYFVLNRPTRSRAGCSTVWAGRW